MLDSDRRFAVTSALVLLMLGLSRADLNAQVTLQVPGFAQLALAGQPPQVPFEINAESVQVVVSSGSLTSLPVTLPLSPYRPGIFTLSGGAPVIVNNSTGRLVSLAEPARVGDVLLIYATGLGPVAPPVSSGSPAPLDSLSRVPAQVTVVIGGANVNPLFVGLAPGFVGVYQINVQIPGGVTTGNPTLYLSAVGSSSNSVQVSIQN